MKSIEKNYENMTGKQYCQSLPVGHYHTHFCRTDEPIKDFEIRVFDKMTKEIALKIQKIGPRYDTRTQCFPALEIFPIIKKEEKSDQEALRVYSIACEFIKKEGRIIERDNRLDFKKVKERAEGLAKIKTGIKEKYKNTPFELLKEILEETKEKYFLEQDLYEKMGVKWGIKGIEELLREYIQDNPSRDLSIPSLSSLFEE